MRHNVTRDPANAVLLQTFTIATKRPQILGLASSNIYVLLSLHGLHVAVVILIVKERLRWGQRVEGARPTQLPNFDDNMSSFRLVVVYLTSLTSHWPKHDTRVTQSQTAREVYPTYKTEQ